MVRGTTRDTANLAVIANAGIEAVCATPDRVGEILDHISDVTLVFWLMGTASGEADQVEALHGPRLERLLEELVDTPVRAFVYEIAATVPPEAARRGREAVEAAWETWRIPFAVLEAEPAAHEEWLAEASAAAGRVLRA
jgi:hypothetical protein